jgi:allantoin racemase
MRIVLINPNSTEAMTEACARTARHVLGPQCDLVALTNHGAPPAIQGAADGEAASPGVLRLIAEHPHADGFIIACFDDTALPEARALASVPVIGIGQASYYRASLGWGRFAVLTTLDVAVPVIEGNIDRLGFRHDLHAVVASGIPVLELESDPEGSVGKLAPMIAELGVQAPGARVILGCAGMTEIADAFGAAPVIDPVESAARFFL